MDSATAASAEALPDLHRQAVRLEQFSIAWMLVEAGVAVTAGIVAGSLALTSFGFDSVIELVSATLVLSFRSACRSRHGSARTPRPGSRPIHERSFKNKLPAGCFANHGRRDPGLGRLRWSGRLPRCPGRRSRSPSR